MSAAARTGRIFHDADRSVVAAGPPERWFASTSERLGRMMDRHVPSPYNPLRFERGKRFGEGAGSSTREASTMNDQDGARLLVEREAELDALSRGLADAFDGR